MASIDPRRWRSLLAGTVPWRSLLLDFLLVVAWVAAISVAFRVAGWSRWLYYLVVFGGVLGYSLATDRWSADA